MEYIKGERYVSKKGEHFEYKERRPGTIFHFFEHGPTGENLAFTDLMLESMELTPYKESEPEFIVGMFGKFSQNKGTTFRFGFLGDEAESKATSKAGTFFLESTGRIWDSFTPCGESILKVNRKWEALKSKKSAGLHFDDSELGYKGHAGISVGEEISLSDVARGYNPIRRA